jgi:hypothetical protein
MGSRSLHLASTAFPARRGTSTAKPAATNFPILGSQILGSPIPDLRSAASGMTMERTVVVPALRNASGLCALLCLARKAAGTVTAQDLPPLSSPRKRGPRTFHRLQTVPVRSILGSPVPDLRCAASGMTMERTVVVSALPAPCSVSPRTSIARSGAHSFPEQCRQGLPVPAGQADRRLGPGCALLLCQDGTRGHGDPARLSCKANAGKNREACG